MGDKSENPNAGHRERLRSRFVKNKLDGFNDYEVIELILTYAIPRKDVKPLAKQLIHHFGSFQGVFNATVAELQLVNGIGDKAAILLALFASVNEFYARECIKVPAVTLKKDKLIKYIVARLRDDSRENFLALFFNAGKELITDIMFPGDISSVPIHKRDIVNVACTHKAAYVVIAHNHPDRVMLFSDNDISATDNLKAALKLVGVELHDHIIIDSHQEYICWSACFQ